MSRPLLEYRCRKCGQPLGEVVVTTEGKKRFRIPRQAYGDRGRLPGQIRTERRHGMPKTYSEAEIYQTDTLGAYRPVCGACKVDFMLVYERVVRDIESAASETRPPMRVFLDPIR